MYAPITKGAMTRAILKLRPTNPIEYRNQPNGFIIAKTKIVGVNNWKIKAASFHFGPRTRRMMSLANIPQATVIGRVSAKSIE
ncbi:MAG: hypothetical protein NTNFB02_01970 [Nitrospira sp.]